MTRREEREQLLVIVFELSFRTKDEFDQMYEFEKAYNSIDSEYVDKAVRGIIKNMDGIDDLISSSSKGWKLSRLSKMTLSIIRLSVYEMIYGKLAYNIAINEAVELAKKYDNDKAPAFVNGVLNNIALASGLKK